MLSLSICTASKSSFAIVFGSEGMRRMRLDHKFGQVFSVETIDKKRWR